VLATIVFLAFWVLLAFALFFVAARGGLGGARAALQTQSRGGRKAVVVIFAVLYVGFGVALPYAFLNGNHANASGQVGGIKLTADEKRGRELFGQNCSVCHTLAAANAVGKVGPNLDTLKPPAQLVLNTINNGCLQNPPANSSEACLGQGTMPAQLVEGKDAQDVADFVAKVAGKE
jgi:mono/diheme cytochrome c family protein